MAQRKRGLCLHVKPGNLTPSWDISKVSPQTEIQTNQKNLAILYKLLTLRHFPEPENSRKRIFFTAVSHPWPWEEKSSQIQTCLGITWIHPNKSQQLTWRWKCVARPWPKFHEPVRKLEVCYWSCESDRTRGSKSGLKKKNKERMAWVIMTASQKGGS